MGLPIVNRPKVSPSDGEASNKPSNTRPSAFPYTSLTSSYRPEMDEISNTSHGNNIRTQDNNNGEGSSTVVDAPGSRSGSVQTATRPVPIPQGRPIQVSSAGEAVLQSWVSLTRGSGGNQTSSGGAEGRENLSSTRSEAERRSDRQARRERRRLEVNRRMMAADSREEALITLDEFLRESRDPTSDNEEGFRSNRSLSIPPINRLRSADNSRRVLSNRTEANSTTSQEGRLDIIRPLGDGIPAVITVPQSIPIATLWSATNAPPEHHISPHETFDTFINNIRRIGNLQDAMLATLRSSNSGLAADAISSSGAAAPSTTNSTENQGTSPATNSATGTTDLRASGSAARSATRPAAQTAGTSTAAPRSTTPPPPFLGTAEARLRAMQARIDILTSEFTLLRSTWATSHAENQGYERSLRRLQELMPSARRAERARRANRGGEVSLLYEDLHADVAAREGESYPRNPWGDSDAERIRERMRMAAASAWMLGREGREGSARPENAGNAAGGSGDGSQAATPVSAPSQPFSSAERELQKEMLAAKMVELTLKGMR